MCAARPGACGADELAPFILVRIVAVYVIVEVGLSVITKEFSSDAP